MGPIVAILLLKAARGIENRAQGDKQNFPKVILASAKQTQRRGQLAQPPNFRIRVKPPPPETSSNLNPSLPTPLRLPQHQCITIMARPKKADEKPKDSGSLQISVEDFVRTRNSVSITHFPHFLFITPWS